MVKYISKGEWFDKGTEAILIDDYGYNAQFNNRVGLFEGIRNGKLDEEVCEVKEFEMWNGNL